MYDNVSLSSSPPECSPKGILLWVSVQPVWRIGEEEERNKVDQLFFARKQCDAVHNGTYHCVRE